jgi:hypothetical protein
MKRIELGLVAALVCIAACSSKDSLLNGGGGKGGGGGTSSGAAGAGGTTGSAGTTGAGGTTGVGGTTGTAGVGGQAGACEAPGLCVRPYECVRACGGPIEYTGCCQCVPPLFDNFNNMACRDGGAGTGGASAGRGGAAGGASGAGGASAGRGGAAGGASGAGGASAGRGGAAGGTSGTGGAPVCQIDALCVRPYVCIRACGGPIESESCCPCEPPLFDNFNNMACRDGGGSDGGRTCGELTTLAECDARSDCHPVFVDPRNCACAAIGCCARFSFCGNGARALCTSPPPAQLVCGSPTPYCESPAYVISYTQNCFEGCVRPADCGP